MPEYKTTQEKEIEKLENLLRETKHMRDEWMAEFVKCRDVLRKIYADTDPYADGASDATPHDKLCNEISWLVIDALGKDGV